MSDPIIGDDERVLSLVRTLGIGPAGQMVSLVMKFSADAAVSIEASFLVLDDDLAAFHETIKKYKLVVAEDLES